MLSKARSTGPGNSFWLSKGFYSGAIEAEFERHLEIMAKFCSRNGPAGTCTILISVGVYSC
jgi:hypothetical protein